MASNNSLELTSLDFNELKNELITFLRQQDRFKDVNYQGSNINALLDVLAYNSYQNAFYLNMVASEMFLDSAQLRSSVVSHAKELNYTPRSFRSAKATLKLTAVTDGSATDFFIPKKTTFTTSVGDNTFTFTTSSSYTGSLVSNTANTFVVESFDVFEGQYLTESYIVNNNVPNQKFVLSSPTIDTTAVTVNVIEDSGEVIYPYSIVNSLYGLEANSKVCFIEATENGRYQITFGDSSFVRKPKDNSVVVIEYRSCSGELPNGADTFTLDTTLTGNPTITLENVSPASGGAVTESNDEIKFNAPRFFQTQERAVTASDYEVLLKQQFPEIRAISAYGGEDADPPQFGKVLISVDLEDADGVTDTKKTEYTQWIKVRMPLSIDPVFVNPEFLYVGVESVVKYNLNDTELTTSDIQSLVQTAIVNFSETNLNDFNKVLRYSRLVDAIDNTDSSIISNDTSHTIFKLLQPEVNTLLSFDVNFYNQITTVTSSRFVYRGVSCYIDDDAAGNLRIINSASKTVVVTSIGAIDYVTGRLTISNITFDSYTSQGLKFTAVTAEKDVSGVKNNIVTIRGVDIKITVQGIRQ